MTFIGLFAQYGPGKPSKGDSQEERLGWFKECLDKVAELRDSEHGLKSVALPWGIGCGLAGGDWGSYEEVIREWARGMEGVEVVLYKLEGSGTGREGGRGGGRGRGRGRGGRRGSGQERGT